MYITKSQLEQIIKEELANVLSEDDDVKKDACYHKVKAVYSKNDNWPSAYASGALVTCRKNGAENWGEGSKDESLIKEEDIDWKEEEETAPTDPEEKRKWACRMANEPENRPQGISQAKMIAVCKGEEVVEAKSYHWDEPDWEYGGGYSDETLEEKKGKGNLHQWFNRQGEPGSKGGWVDCNAPIGDGKYKSCAPDEDEKREKEPACRPTPARCKDPGKGTKWGKKSGKNENLAEGFLYEGDASILEAFRGATLEEGGLVCEACLFETLQEASCGCPDLVGEAVYQGETVKLNSPSSGDVKKFKVYVNSGKKDKKGRIKAKKVNFGQKGVRIKKSDPEKRANFRARHNCSTATDNKTPRYWSCKK